MKNAEYFEEYPIIIFQRELDDEDVAKVLSIFEKWIYDEIDKRATKKGVLFEFTYVNIPTTATLRFGNQKNSKYVNIMEGYCGDYFKQQEIHKYYERIVEGALEIANRVTAEYGLGTDLKPSEGLATYYVVFR